MENCLWRHDEYNSQTPIEWTNNCCWWLTETNRKCVCFTPNAFDRKIEKNWSSKLVWTVKQKGSEKWSRKLEAQNRDTITAVRFQSRRVFTLLAKNQSKSTTILKIIMIDADKRGLQQPQSERASVWGLQHVCCCCWSNQKARLHHNTVLISMPDMA